MFLPEQSMSGSSDSRSKKPRHPAHRLLSRFLLSSSDNPDLSGDRPSSPQVRSFPTPQHPVHGCERSFRPVPPVLHPQTFLTERSVSAALNSQPRIPLPAMLRPLFLSWRNNSGNPDLSGDRPSSPQVRSFPTPQHPVHGCERSFRPVPPVLHPQTFLTERSVSAALNSQPRIPLPAMLRPLFLSWRNNSGNPDLSG